MIRDYFSLTAWGPTIKGAAGEFWLFRLDADWSLGAHHAKGSPIGSVTFPLAPWFAVNLGLLGFSACITYWPDSKKQFPDRAVVGREHGEAGE